MELLIAVLVFLAVLAPQAYAVAVWQGNWRWFAAAPLLLMATDILLILGQTSIDPTSHNLWPFELAIIALIGLPVVGMLWWCDQSSGAHPEHEPESRLVVQLTYYF